jgi:hypothetical protein
MGKFDNIQHIRIVDEPGDGTNVLGAIASVAFMRGNVLGVPSSRHGHIVVGHEDTALPSPQEVVARAFFADDMARRFEGDQL